MRGGGGFGRRDLLIASALAVPMAITSKSADADQTFIGYGYPVGTSTASRTTSTRFSETYNVKDFGAMGDGVTDDTNAIQAAVTAAYGPSSNPNGLFGAGANSALYFPAGFYKITNEIVFTAIEGAYVYGATPRSAFIQNQSTTGTACFRVNGAAYSCFENLSFNLPNSTGTCVVWQLELTPPASTYQVNLQSVTCKNLRTDGGFNGHTVGVLDSCGAGNTQGSEFVWMNCSFNNHAGAGMQTGQQNALMHWFYGGNCHNCQFGILNSNDQGSTPNIEGMHFDGQALAPSTATNGFGDIVINVSSPDAYFISGCRTTSSNFIWVTAGAGGTIEGCVQFSTTGFFVIFQGTGPVGDTIQAGSWSVTGNQVGGVVQANGSVIFSGNTVLAPPQQFVINNTNGGLITLYNPSSALSVSGLPSAPISGGLRLSVVDSSVDPSHSSNYGIALSGGGSFTAPVWSDATNWRLG